MIYLFSLIVAAMIATAQSLWKIAVDNTAITVSKEYLSSAEFISILISPYIWGGIILYGLATIFYVVMLSKFYYVAVVTLVLSMTLIIATIISWTFFAEKISTVNIIGVVTILIGIVLVHR